MDEPSCQRAETPAQAQADRRAFVRFACPDDAFYYARAQGQGGVSADFQDISRHGISLLFDQEVKPGTILSVEFHNKTQELPCFLLAQVRHARLQADGRWLIGCQFTGPLRDSELKNFGLAQS